MWSHVGSGIAMMWKLLSDSLYPLEQESVLLVFNLGKVVPYISLFGHIHYFEV